MKYLLRGGPADDECKAMVGTPDSIQHFKDGVFTFYFPTDEVFELDGEQVTVYEPTIDTPQKTTSDQ
jgi:hypothetical protein